MIEETGLDGSLLDGNLHGKPVGDIAAALVRKRVPFLFVTGYGRDALPEGFGKVAILSKPFSSGAVSTQGLQRRAAQGVRLAWVIACCVTSERKPKSWIEERHSGSSASYQQPLSCMAEWDVTCCWCSELENGSWPNWPSNAVSRS
jgi:hypothetical protein